MYEETPPPDYQLKHRYNQECINDNTRIYKCSPPNNQQNKPTFSTHPSYNYNNNNNNNNNNQNHQYRGKQEKIKKIDISEHEGTKGFSLIEEWCRFYRKRDPNDSFWIYNTHGIRLRDRYFTTMLNDPSINIKQTEWKWKWYIQESPTKDAEKNEMHELVITIHGGSNFKLNHFAQSPSKIENTKQEMHKITESFWKSAKNYLEWNHILPHENQSSIYKERIQCMITRHGDGNSFVQLYFFSAEECIKRFKLWLELLKSRDGLFLIGISPYYTKQQIKRGRSIKAQQARQQLGLSMQRRI